jgi:hypothetical protein
MPPHSRESHSANAIQDGHRNPNQRFSGLGFEIYENMFPKRNGAAKANICYAAVVGDPRTCHRDNGAVTASRGPPRHREDAGLLPQAAARRDAVRTRGRYRKPRSANWTGIATATAPPPKPSRQKADA